MRKFLSIIFLFSACSTILHGCDSGSAPAGEDSNTDTGTTSSPDLYVENTGGYRQFRIPAVVLTSDGTLLAFAEGRKYSGSDTGNIDLVLRRSTDGGQTWNPMQVIWDDGDNTCGNPAPVVDPETGRILLPGLGVYQPSIDFCLDLLNAGRWIHMFSQVIFDYWVLAMASSVF